MLELVSAVADSPLRTGHLPKRCTAGVIKVISSGRSRATAGSVVHFNPVAIQIAARFCRDVNHVGMFLLRRISRDSAGQLEVQLSWFSCRYLGVVDRGFDLAIHKKNDFIIRDRQLAHAVMAIRIG